MSGYRMLLLVLMAATARAGTFNLTVTATHGTVIRQPDKALYDENELVRLIPRPASGYRFAGWTGDLVSHHLVCYVVMTGNRAVTANLGPWTPPLGVPAPSFGILETHRMHDTPANRNPALTYTQNDEGDYYTHYVDNTHPSATCGPADADWDIGASEYVPPVGGGVQVIIMQ